LSHLVLADLEPLATIAVNRQGYVKKAQEPLGRGPAEAGRYD
jgi:hypothetical protein